MPETKFGTWAELMAASVPELRPIADRLREIIYDVDPDTVEVVRLGDGAATYGVGPRKMIEGYAYIAAQKTYCNLGFMKGAVLPDPAGLLEGTGKKLRHVKVRTLEDAERPEIRDLLAAAVVERTHALSS